MNAQRLAFAAPILLAFAHFACSSATPAPAAPAQNDADAGADAGATPPVDAAPATDASEPPWSGTTVEPGCTVNGCIHSFAKATQYPKGLLAGHAATGQHVDNGIAVWKITYVSDGVETTGSVYVPDSAPPSDGFPVMVMNQFTSGVGPPCAPSVGQLGVGVASATALRGVLTIVPDATSYGGGKLGVYLAAPPEGRAALDAARAAFHLGPALGVTIARRAVIGGLSQGGQSTLAAASEMPTYAPQLEIKGFAAVAPATHLRSVLHAVAQKDSGFTWFVVARMQTWQQHYGLSGGALFRPPYDAQIEGWLETECEFDGATGNDGTLPSHFPDAPSAVLSDEFLGYAKTDAWPADWSTIYDQSTPMPPTTTPPIVIWQGDADTTVNPADTQDYVSTLTAAGVAVDYRIVAGGTHGATALSSFTVQQPASDDAFTWIQQHLTP